jgi:NAD(P)-dependent dehydrogenase (short-subunit alcohol dehydrogenase family)
MKPLVDLTGRRIMVTGASSGLGRATAVLLSQLGAAVVLVARDEHRLADSREQLAPGTHAIVQRDLADLENLVDWMTAVATEHGPLDGLVHAAGIQMTRPLRMLDAPKVQHLMDINLLAALQLARGFRQRMVHTESSSIVFLSSVMGLVGQAAVVPYAASKGALVAAAKALAMELAPEGIRVNCVAPGHVATPMATKVEATLTEGQLDAIRKMHPLGLGTPEDVAGAIAFLLADTGRWITGTTLVVDGGYTAH